jgi:hypothetical protein
MRRKIVNGWFRDVADAAAGRRRKTAAEEEADDELNELASRMLDTIEKKEVVAAILQMRVRREIWRVVLSGLAVFGLSAFGVVYYLAAVVPSQAVKEATELLETSLRAKLGELKSLNGQIDQLVASAQATGQVFSAKAAALREVANKAITQESEIAAQLQQLSTNKDSLRERLNTLTGQLKDAEPQIGALNDPAIRAAISELKDTKGDMLKTFMKSLPPHALVLSADICPAGWKEDESAQGALFVGAGTGKNPVPRTLVLKPSDIPSLRMTGATVAADATLNIPTALRVGETSGSNPLVLVSCKDRKCVATQSSSVPVSVPLPVLSVQGSAGSANPTAVRRLYAIHVCKAA